MHVIIRSRATACDENVLLFVTKF